MITNEITMSSKRLIPITERPNELTLDLDMAEPEGIARLLRQGDAQLFSGYNVYPGLMDAEIQEKCAKIAIKAADAIEAGENGVVLLAGAGTSGRFAHLISRQFNRFLRAAGKAEVFKPLVAGGALALVKAQEGAEDDPIQARNDLENRLPEKPESILYFGITCGLSAPYIAGQMDALCDNEKATNVLMGFNTRDTARNVEIEGWDKTFRQVLEACEKTDRFHLLNPIYGPESIMGSTRLKGGSITKILLEAIFFAALELTEINRQAEGSLSKADRKNISVIAARIRSFFRRYSDTIQATYDHLGSLSELIKNGGSTLRCGGRIAYLGRETAGIVGLIDASECPPTFGATFDDIRCFMRGGWDELLDTEGEDHSSNGPEFQIDLRVFEDTKVESLSKGDFVLGIAIGELGPNTRLLLEMASKTKATVALLMISKTPNLPADLPISAENVYLIQVPELGFITGFTNLAELSLKIALNALSSGAHIMIGKVYNNRMIDLKISNNKLYFRAIRTIATLGNCTEDDAKMALHRAVYKQDSLSDDQVNASPSKIIAEATSGYRTVPTALLLALGNMTYDQVTEMLSRDPVPRRVINDVLTQATSEES